jgi:hypothetical protein
MLYLNQFEYTIITRIWSKYGSVFTYINYLILLDFSNFSSSLVSTQFPNPNKLPKILINLVKSQQGMHISMASCMTIFLLQMPYAIATMFNCFEQVVLKS